MALEQEQDPKFKVSVSVNAVDDFPNAPEYKNLVNRKKYKKPQVKIGEWNQRTAQSYIDNGLKPPSTLDWEVKWFLATADPKHEFERNVTKIVKIVAPDYDSKKKELKEYVYWYENWHGRDFVGRKLDVGDHVEGMYKEQLMEGVLYDNQIVGERRTGERVRYYIPFSKKAVDDIIAKSTGTDRDGIHFVVKHPHGRIEVSYDVFVNMTIADYLKHCENESKRVYYATDLAKPYS